MSQEHLPPPSLHTLTLGWQLFENSPDCVKLLSMDGRILAMNGAGRCAIGVEDFAAIEGAPWKSIWPADIHATLDAALAAAAAGGTGRFKGCCLTVKGQPRWWDVTINLIASPDSQEGRLLAVSRDITEHKLAEAGLHESRERFEKIVSQAATGVVEMDTRGRITFANRKYADMR